MIKNTHPLYFMGEQEGRNVVNYINEVRHAGEDDELASVNLVVEQSRLYHTGKGNIDGALDTSTYSNPLNTKEELVKAEKLVDTMMAQIGITCTECFKTKVSCKECVIADLNYITMRIERTLEQK